MNTVVKPGQAGTLESNDIVVTVAPAAVGAGIEIDLTSPVVKQYGKKIRQAIEEQLAEQQVSDVKVQAIDKGALDCTIKARVKTAVERALA